VFPVRYELDLSSYYLEETSGFNFALTPPSHLILTLKFRPNGALPMVVRKSATKPRYISFLCCVITGSLLPITFPYSLPNALPPLQPTFTRRSWHCAGIFTVHYFMLSLLVTNLVSLSQCPSFRVLLSLFLFKLQEVDTSTKLCRSKIHKMGVTRLK
jgi:hypothetical protein